MRLDSTDILRRRILPSGFIFVDAEFYDSEYGIVDYVEVVGVDAFRYFRMTVVVLDFLDALYFDEYEVVVG